MASISAYTHPSGAVYAAPAQLNQSQTLSALGHSINSGHIIATVPNMGLSPSIASMALSHTSSSIQKLMSLPPPKVRKNFLMS